MLWRVVLSCVLASAPSEAPGGHAVSSTLVPEAQELQRRGDEAIAAGRHAEAHWYYTRAYDLTLPIPDQEAREVLRANIHRALWALYEGRGEVRYLCQSWALHERHSLDLARAGAPAGAGATPTTRAIEVEVLRVSGEPVARACARRAGARPRALAGGALLGFGLAGVGVGIHAGLVYGRDHGRIQELEARFPEAPRTDLEAALLADLVAHGNRYRTATIVAGAVAGALLIASVALFAGARRIRPVRPRTTRLAIVGGGVRLAF